MKNQNTDQELCVSVLILKNAGRMGDAWIVTAQDGTIYQFNSEQSAVALIHNESLTIISENERLTMAACQPAFDFEQMMREPSPAERRQQELWRELGRLQAGFWRLADPDTRHWWRLVSRYDPQTAVTLLRIVARLYLELGHQSVDMLSALRTAAASGKCEPQQLEPFLRELLDLDDGDCTSL